MPFPTYVISDLHLGCEFCRSEKLEKFLRNLPPGVSLVLNGDVVTRWNRALAGKDYEILDLLRSESDRRSITWLRGNHDSKYELEDPRQIKFADTIVDQGVMIAHGHQFDKIRSLCRPAITTLYWLHRLRIRLKMRPVPMAATIMGMEWLFKPYKKLFIHNAVRTAIKHNCKTILCGHIHVAEEVHINNIHYLNTGSWIDDENHYIEINDDHVELRRL